MYLLVFPSPSPQATICPGHRAPKVPQPTGVRGKSQASLQNAACLSPICSPASAPSMAAAQTSLTLAADSSTALKSHLLAPLFMETNFLKLSQHCLPPTQTCTVTDTMPWQPKHWQPQRQRNVFLSYYDFFQFLFWSIFKKYFKPLKKKRSNEHCRLFT